MQVLMTTCRGIPKSEIPQNCQCPGIVHDPGAFCPRERNQALIQQVAILTAGAITHKLVDVRLLPQNRGNCTVWSIGRGRHAEPVLKVVEIED